MNKVKKTTDKGSRYEGFAQTFSITSAVEPPAPALYHFHGPYIPHPTYGIVVPVEMASYAPTNLHVPTAGLEATSKIIISLRTTEGEVDYSTAPLDINPPETLRFMVPQDVLKKCADNHVDIKYDIIVMDGPTQGSATLTVKVTGPLTYKRPVIEGLDSGFIKVSEYPNGLNVDGGVIGNVEPSALIHCRWRVYIPLEWPNEEIIYECNQSHQPTPGQPYIFRIPKEAYSDPSWIGSTLCRCYIQVDFAPHDPLLQMWGTGGHNFAFK